MTPVPFAVRVIRVGLGLIFVIYGAVKLAGGQFYHGQFTIDSRDLDPTAFVWTFFGYSRVYGWFIGLGELIPGLLLLFSRTATLGALILLPVTLNITVMTFAFGFPSVKYASLVYTVLAAWLVWRDLPRLLPAVLPDTRPPAAPVSRAARGVTLAIGVPFLVVMVNALVASLSPGPEPAVKAALIARGSPPDSLDLVRSSYYGPLGFDRTGFVEYRISGRGTAYRATVRRPTSFVGWRIEDIHEVDPQARSRRSPARPRGRARLTSAPDPASDPLALVPPGP